MEDEPLAATMEDSFVSANGEKLSRQALLQQLDYIVDSRHFRNSRRYPKFLRFVVEQTLSGSTEILKERNLGTAVFERPDDYDTNADPIVRVTAGEIRRRLAQYYQGPGHEDEPRIELPVGSYVPHFYGPGERKQPPEASTGSPAAAATPGDVPEAAPVLPAALPRTREKARSPAWKIAAAAVLFCLLAAALGFFAYNALQERQHISAINYVWQPLLQAANPVTVVIGTHTFDRNGREQRPEEKPDPSSQLPENMLSAMVRSEMVPISDIVSYSRVTDLLTRQGHAYTTLSSSHAGLERLRVGPVLLIGGLDNLWTIRLTSKLRYRFAWHGEDEGDIFDSQHPEIIWKFDNLQREIVNTNDYAIVAGYFDPTFEQPVIIVAGIGKTGTDIASEFLTGNEHLRAWLNTAKPAAGKNFELVLQTQILDGKPGPPHVVASALW